MKKEEEKYKIPSNYFIEFQSKLQTQIELEQLVGSQRNAGFTVPDDYFSTLSRKLSQIPLEQKSKVTTLQTRYWPAIGIAATALLVFGLWLNNINKESDAVALDDIAAYLDTESADLHTEDILSLLSEEDLNTILLNDESQPDDDIIHYLENYSNAYDILLE